MSKGNFLRLVIIKYPFLLLLASVSFRLPAADWGDVARRTDRRDNWWLLELLRGADLAESLEVAQALGAREDAYAEEILEGLIADASGRSADRTEHLIRVLLESLFPPRLPPEEAARRAALNRAAVGRLVEDLPRFADPLLRARLLRLIPFTSGVDAAGLLMREGRDLARTLSGGRGLAGGPAGLAAEAAAFLEAAGASGRAELAEPCIRLAEAAADPGLVKEARRVAELLLSAAGPPKR